MQRFHAIAHAASGLLLGTLWFGVFVSLWATGIGTIVTLLGLPIIWLTLVLAREAGALEAYLARELLGAEAAAPARHSGWDLLGRLRDVTLWRAQAYLLTRFVLGLISGTLVIGPLVQGAAMVVAPAWYWAPKDGIQWGFWTIDTLGEAFAAIPVGIVLIAAGWWLAGPYGLLWRRLAGVLLPGSATGGSRLALVGWPLWQTAAVAGTLQSICVIVWLATDPSSVWPAWTAHGLAIPVGVHAALMLRPEAPARIRALTRHGALAIVLWLVCFFAWLIPGGGYFWPIWPLFGLTTLWGVHAVYVFSMRNEDLKPRVEELTRTRADVVGAQEDELRRIERDLHDGAQARLVSLAMSLGLAESRLDEDPDRARELMAEAQQEARRAIKELRDLARGIAPPVLQDRGLEAAITALAATAPIPVVVEGDGSRAPAAVERAGYFVAAEALANAAKHSGARRIDVAVTRWADRLEVEVSDDGAGGADPAGSGLVGLRQRVEAIDGTLEVASPAGRGTIIRASLPCASS